MGLGLNWEKKIYIYIYIYMVQDLGGLEAYRRRGLQGSTYGLYGLMTLIHFLAAVS